MRHITFLLLAVVVVPSAARGAVRYRVTNMNEVWAEELTERYVGLGMDRSEAEFQAAQEAAGILMHGINNNGQMTGSYRENVSDSPRAILWSPEQGLQDLGLTGSSSGMAINDSGMIVGTANLNLFDGGRYRPFIWSPASGVQALELPVERLGYGMAVNNRGEFVGFLTGGIPFADVFMSETATSGYVYIGEGKTFINGGVLAINDSGQVVGTYYHLQDATSQPFIWDSENGLRDLPQGDSLSSFANDINNAGTIVGFTYGDANSACIWENGQIRFLDGFEEKFSEATSSQASFINELGMVVGTFNQPPSQYPQSTVFIWEPDGGVWDVNELLPVEDRLPDHLSIQLQGLTDDGAILLSMFNIEDSSYSTLLLRPVPEPSCFAFIFVLLMTLACSSFARRIRGTR